MWLWDLLSWCSRISSWRVEDFTSLFVDRNDGAGRAHFGKVYPRGRRIVVDQKGFESSIDRDRDVLANNENVCAIGNTIFAVGIIRVGNAIHWVGSLFMKGYRVGIEISFAALAVIVSHFSIVDVDILIVDLRQIFDIGDVIIDVSVDRWGVKCIGWAGRLGWLCIRIIRA